MEGTQEREEFTLVTRKSYFGLPTACPICLPVYLYLKFARIPFQLAFNSMYPDSDQIPYIEAGTYVAYNNEKGGVIERLKQDGVVDLDTGIHSLPEWISMKAMISSWLAEALEYELWLGSDGSSAHEIYYSDLSWPIGKVLFCKQQVIVKQRLGITKANAEQREEEIYKRAKVAYGALSTRLGDEKFLFENRPSSLDALFAGHVLVTLHALPESSVLRTKLMEHSNLVRSAEGFKVDFIEAGSSSSSAPNSVPSPTASRKGPSSWSSKPKSKPKREKTEEEKTFKRRAKYFVGAQVLAVLLFVSIMGGGYDGESVLDDDDDGDGYE